jgi:hypothetical protein
VSPSVAAKVAKGDRLAGIGWEARRRGSQYVGNTEGEAMKEPKYKSCNECKPSTWQICLICGRYYCEHNGGGVCWHCLANPQKMIERVTTVYVGRLTAEVWRTEYGAYRSQTDPVYYRRKDANEMLAAAKRLGLTVHLQERPHYSKWRDWYGRPCGYSDGTFHLWVEMDATTIPAEVGRKIKDERNEALIADLMPRLRKPRSEWTYKDHETYHRMMGTL